MDSRRAVRLWMSGALFALVLAPLGGRATAAASAAAGYAGPARGVGVRPSGVGLSQFTSRNWDGYITYTQTEGTDFNAVSASWVQPAITCNEPDAWSVFWVGLDGWWNNTVEQGGSSARCIAGVPHYAAWWEMYPTVPIETTFAISPGDHITATVTYKPSKNKFVITVVDTTNGMSRTKNEACAAGLTCARSSADVIAEDVGRFGAGDFFPLADYGRMTFTGSKITDINGNKGSFSSSSWLDAAVTESASGITYAKVSNLSAHGKDFDAIWKHE